MIRTYKTLSYFLAGAAAFITFPVLAQQSTAEDTSRWDNIKPAIFKEITIVENENTIQIEAPDRAYDAAIVPIKVNVNLEAEDFVEKLFIVVDNNPAPLAATFKFKTQQSKMEIQTRIRINEYTTVRAIAQSNSGEYYMSKAFVKASGGCSAPALSDQEAALARAGKMKFKIGESSEQLPHSSIGQVLISHPNNSGMQFDQISRNYIPAYFVNQVSVRLDDEELFVLETNFSLSENPSIHFSFDMEQKPDSVISVKAIDSNNGTFENTWKIKG